MRNYLLVLIRTLQRERVYAAINIAGLSLGVACCLLLGMFLWSELTYDRQFANHERIYRIENEFSIAGTHDRFAVTSRALGPMLVADYPVVKAFVRFQPNGSGAGGSGGVAIHHGTDTYYWDNSFYADDNVFDVLSPKIIAGDPKTALKDPSSVAISETVAKRYFGSGNPVGETLTTDAGLPARVTLVFADLPPNTHLKFDLLFSGNAAFLRDPDNPTQRRQSLFGVGVYTYLLMAPGVDPNSWPHISDEFFKRYMADTAKTMNATWV